MIQHSPILQLFILCSKVLVMLKFDFQIDEIIQCV